MYANTFTRTTLKRLVPAAVVALLLIQCSSEGGDTTAGSQASATDDRHSGDTIRRSDGATRTSDGTWVNVSSEGALNSDAHASNVHLYPGKRPVPATAAEERAMTNSDMHGLRAILLADLELVRTRLNDGTRTNDQKATDQALAGELAQGLERVDRALVAMDSTTDATWNTVRNEQLKQVKEVRLWMVGYRENGLLRG